MNDTPLKIERHEILEQQGSPTVRFAIDGHTFILPYAFFVRAECHRQDDRFLIIAHWTTLIVTIEGYRLDNLVQWLAEYRLLSVALRTEVEKGPDEKQPYLERILITMREEPSSRGKAPRRNRKMLTESVGRPWYHA
jgi:hypothetical protein